MIFFGFYFRRSTPVATAKKVQINVGYRRSVSVAAGVDRLKIKINRKIKLIGVARATARNSSKNNMKNIIITVVITTLLCATVLFFWLNYSSTVQVTYSGYTEPETAKNDSSLTPVKIGEFFECFAPDATNSVAESRTFENWPNFRGSDHSNIYTKKIIFDDSKELKPLWTIPLGEGHAAAAVYNGQVFVLDYLEDIEADAIRCFDLQTGKEIWRRWTKMKIKRNHGKSRTIPAVDEDVVLTMSPKCQVMCVKRTNGEMLWGIDLPTKYGTDIPMWYTGQCPLIDNNQAIIAIGTDDTLVAAFDTITGKELWSVPNPYKIKMSHSSIVPMTIMGKRCYVYAGIGGITAISAEDSDLGSTLWNLRDWVPNVIAPTPIQLTDDSMFFTAGYGAGSAIVTIKKKGNKYIAELEDAYSPKDGIALEQQSPIKFKDYIIAILPKDAGTLRTQLVASKVNSPKNIIFSSGKELTFGLGPFVVANDKIYALSDDGNLSIFDFNDNGFIEIKTQKILDGHDAWGPIAIADGYLIARDSKNMTCIKLSQ